MSPKLFNYIYIFQPQSDIIFHINSNVVDEYFNLPLRPSSYPVKHFTLNDNKFTIDKYFAKKSPGYDLIIAEGLKKTLL